MRQQDRVAVGADECPVGLGGKDVGDQRRRHALGAVAAGQRRDDRRRAPETLAERGQRQARADLRDVAVGQRRQRRGGLRRGPVGRDPVADFCERQQGRRVDRIDAQRRDPPVGELDGVGVDADLGALGCAAEGRIVGEAAGGCGVERQRTRLEHGLAGDLLDGGAAGEQIVDRGGILVDRRSASTSARSWAMPALASSNGVVVAARMALIR